MKDVLTQAFEQVEVLENPYKAYMYVADKETLHYFNKMYNLRFRTTYRFKRAKRRKQFNHNHVHTLGFKLRK